jgi:vacuolar-type H+-ATPase subunit F/Vma7
MGEVVVLGERGRVIGFAAAGARVVEAADPDEVQRAWHDLPPDVAVLVLTPAAARALGDLAATEPVPSGPLTVVMPESSPDDDRDRGS